MLRTAEDLRILRGLALFVFALAFISAIFEPRFSFCMFYNLTGLPCPGCGFTRSLAALLLLDPARSVYLHPFGVPGFFALLLLFLPASWLLRPGMHLSRLLLGGAIVLIGFGTVRAALLLIDRSFYSQYFYPFEDPGLFSGLQLLLSQ
ncbi:MAG: DUF2752 domain-containing protein [Spirochaetales bacterium]|nr:DUF2752 domain-containing protein [Spirochaetales bacterium]